MTTASSNTEVAPLAGRILVTGSSVDHRLLKPLEGAGLDVINPQHLLGEDELITELRGCVGYLLGGDEYATERVLSQSRTLKTIAFLGMGYENYVDFQAASRLQIAITNTPGTLTDSVAEYGVGQLVNARRRLGYYATATRSGLEMEEPEKERHLRGHSFGIVGLGAVGTRIAEILTQGFHAKVSYWSRTRTPAIENKLGIAYLPLEELVGAVEGLVVATIGTDDTRDLINSALVSAMAPGMTIVNVARATVINPTALRKGLESNTIRTAVFDPFYENDSVAKPLLADFDESRLVITPHIASLTHDARDAMASTAVNSILNVLRNGTDEFIVNGV